MIWDDMANCSSPGDPLSRNFSALTQDQEKGDWRLQAAETAAAFAA
jgi:hypothetical protein